MRRREIMMLNKSVSKGNISSMVTSYRYWDCILLFISEQIFPKILFLRILDF